MHWTSLIVTVWKVVLLKRKRTLVSAGAFSNVDAFSNAPQYFYRTSVSYAIAIKLLNWCLYGASPVQGTVIWNISFEVLMDHLYVDIVGAKNERGELSRASNACGGFPAELPAGSCCQPLLPVLDHLQEPKVGQSCVAFWCRSAFSLFTAIQDQAPGLRLLLFVGNAGCSPVFWVRVGWLDFFCPGKIPLTLLSCINLGGLSLLSLLGAGGMWGKQAEGRGILSCLRHLLHGWRGCRAEPRSLPQSDLIYYFF